MKPDRPARRVAFGAVFSALAVALMSISLVVPTLDLTLAALAAIPVYIALLEFRAASALSVYVIAGALSLLLLPDKSCAVFFCALFGWYPFLRNAVSRLPLWLSILCKILGGALGAAAIYLVFSYLFLTPEVIEQITIPVLVLFPIVFFVYDYGLGKLMVLYTAVIRPKLNR